MSSSEGEAKKGARTALCNNLTHPDAFLHHVFLPPLRVPPQGCVGFVPLAPSSRGASFSYKRGVAAARYDLRRSRKVMSAFGALGAARRTLCGGRRDEFIAARLSARGDKRCPPSAGREASFSYERGVADARYDLRLRRKVMILLRKSYELRPVAIRRRGATLPAFGGQGGSFLVISAFGARSI